MCGPQGYTNAVAGMLAEMSVPESAVHHEAFSQSNSVSIAGFAAQKLVYGLLAVAIVVGAGLFALKNSLDTKQPASSATTTQTYDAGTNNSPASNTSSSTSAGTGATTTTQNTSSGSTSSQHAYVLPQYYQRPSSTMS